MEFLCQVSLSLLLLSGACNPTTIPANNKPTVMTASSDYRQLAQNRLKGDIKYVFNQAHTLVLCFTNESVAAPAITNSINFLIIQLEDDRVLYQDHLANALVEWFNNTQLKISTLPGIVRLNTTLPENYYLYDIETKQKLPPGASKM